jgi:hypothetical protein
MEHTFLSGTNPNKNLPDLRPVLLATGKEKVLKFIRTDKPPDIGLFVVTLIGQLVDVDKGDGKGRRPWSPSYVPDLKKVEREDFACGSMVLTGVLTNDHFDDRLVWEKEDADTFLKGGGIPHAMQAAGMVRRRGRKYIIARHGRLWNHWMLLEDRFLFRLGAHLLRVRKHLRDKIYFKEGVLTWPIGKVFVQDGELRRLLPTVDVEATFVALTTVFTADALSATDGMAGL